LQATFFARIASFTSWFHQEDTFFSLFTTPSGFRPHIRAEDEATAALDSFTSPLRPLCIPGALGTRTTVSTKVFLHPCLAGPPYLFSRTNAKLNIRLPRL